MVIITKSPHGPMCLLWTCQNQRQAESILIKLVLQSVFPAMVSHKVGDRGRWGQIMKPCRKQGRSWMFPNLKKSLTKMKTSRCCLMEESLYRWFGDHRGEVLCVGSLACPLANSLEGPMHLPLCFVRFMVLLDSLSKPWGAVLSGKMLTHLLPPNLGMFLPSDARPECVLPSLTA